MSGAMAGAHEEDALGKAYDRRLMGRLLRYVRPYRRRVAAAVAVLIAGSLLELVGPWLTKVAIDVAIPRGDVALLTGLAVAYVLALALAFLLEYAQTLLTTWLGQRIMYDLRREIFHHLQRLSVPFFDRNPVGRLMTRVTNDVEVLNELFSSGIVTVFGDIFTLLFIVGAMFVLDWRLALVALAVMPAVVAAAFYFRGRIRDAFRDIRVRLARINAFLQERLSGIGVLQLFGREAHTAARFREINRDYLDAHLRSITYYALFFPVMEVLAAVALALIITYGGVGILGGTVSVGVVAAFLQYARRFFRPIQDLSEKYNMLQGAMASSERIFKLLDTEPSIRDPEHPLHLPADGRGRIEFRDVWFAYNPPDERGDAAPGEPGDGAPAAAAGTSGAPGAAPGAAGAGPGRGAPAAAPAGHAPAGPAPAGHSSAGHVPAGHVPAGHAPAGDGGGHAPWVLRGVSFTIEPGERVAIVGHTGAGKTTIINLLMRFYEPQRGQILSDGVPIDRVPVAELRSRIGLVLQDVFLFSRDVGYNIRLGRDDIPDERVRLAVERVGADRVIDRLPRGLAEPLGERGSSLSVGERQLLSFARALAFDPRVLVLDEATSSVDSELEAQIERALDTLMRGRTSLVIAHRLSTVQNADRILVMHRGELREAGTHEELLARGGLYARLHELQFAKPVAAGEDTAA
ncbi:MAG TPA: ABC transporter ATP-binding protein [Longimicrobiales bacterium]